MSEMDQINEATACVDELNNLYYDQTLDEEKVPFDFLYATHYMCIKYNDEIIWDNQDMPADYADPEDDDCDVREPILDCVRKRVRHIHEIIRKFNP
jgi:hypothetical protein